MLMAPAASLVMVDKTPSAPLSAVLTAPAASLVKVERAPSTPVIPVPIAPPIIEVAELTISPRSGTWAEAVNASMATTEAVEKRILLILRLSEGREYLSVVGVNWK